MTRMRFNTLAAALVAACCLSACALPPLPARPTPGQPAQPAAIGTPQGTSVERTLFVGPDLQNCTGVGPQTCLDVKTSPSGDYELFYDHIDGFEFEPGYEYELRVRQDKVANPPADASDSTWTLIEVVNKTAVAGAKAYTVQLFPVECPHRVPNDLEEGLSLLCGVMRLPQDRAQPDGLQVVLPYALVKSSTVGSTPDPLLYIVGGPGGSALTEFENTFSWFRSFRAERDIIIYDQRGTRLADPWLDCTRYQTGLDIEAEKRRAEALVPADYRPVNEEAASLPLCAEQFKNQGIDLTKYDTATHAQDATDLVEALGYDTFNVYGTSYGTRVALELMRINAPGLRAVVLDSTYPPEANAYETQHISAPFEIALGLLDACAAEAACKAAFPDVKARFGQLVNKLNQSPLPYELGTNGQFTGNNLVTFVLGFKQPDWAPYFPLIIDELDRGETATLTRLMGEATSSTPQAAEQPAPKADFDFNAVSQFVSDFQDAYFKLVDASNPLSETIRAEYSLAIARNPSKGALAKIIDLYFPVDVKGSLLDRLNGFTDAAVIAVFSNLAGPPGAPLSTAANLASECRDELPFNNFERAMRSYQPLNIPQASVQFQLDTIRDTYAQCALFPTGAADPVQTAPVTSSVPTLAFQGLLDATTPLSWIKSALPTLSNHFYFEFPAQIHVMIRQPKSLESGCAANIAIEFLNNPAQAPDASCIRDTYGFQFVTQ